MAAAELELADHLAEGPLAVDVLAERTHSQPSTLFRLMRALESIGIFTQVSPRIFANTPASDCLRKNVPGSQWAYVRLYCPDMGVHEAWADLVNSIKTGQTAFNHVTA